MEHKKYPFFGWQFHPEMVTFEHNDEFDLNKSEQAMLVNNLFGKFIKYPFGDEVVDIKSSDIYQF